MVILFIEHFGLIYSGRLILFNEVYNCMDYVYGEQNDCFNSGSDLNHVSCLENRRI